MLAERLKNETRAQHEAIEASLGILMSPALTRERYAKLIERFYSFHADFEPRALAALPDGELKTMLNERLKTPLLSSDLEALGYAPSAIGAIEQCTSQASVPVDSPARVLGTMYVIEGSTLGGQIISKQIERQLGLSEGRGYSYLRGAGPATMPRWRQFKTLFETPEATEDADEVIAAAAVCFERLMAWLARK